MPPDKPSPQDWPRPPDPEPFDSNAPWPAALPAATDAAAFDFGDQPRDAGPVVACGDAAHRAARSRRRRRWLDEVLGAEEADEFRSLAARMRDRLDDFVRRSQPFTASFCVHMLAFIMLALFLVRVTRDQRRPIELTFTTNAPAEVDQAGAQVLEPQPEPEPVPEPEVKNNEQPVVDPAAAPVVEEAEAVATLGDKPEPAMAPAVGSLLEGREAGQRERLVAAFGGSDVTEAAVARALAWLVKQQRKDGLWSLQGPYLDGGSQENRLAATAMALLALQGAGNTTTAGAHQRVVAAGWAALLKKQVVKDAGPSVIGEGRSDVGRFVFTDQDPPTQQRSYAQAQATIALCELYGMTKDPALEQPARRAVAYAVAAQGPNGGWRYEPGTDGDMSVTGWFMMALKSAQMAGIDVPAETLAGIERFLDAAAVEGGSRYGYLLDTRRSAVDPEDVRFVSRGALPVTDAVSAEGLLCRQYLGWPRDHPQLVRGVGVLLEEPFLDWDHDKDVYAWYYTTQVVHHLGGPAWERWNGRMRELLPAVQVSTAREAGSWDPAGDQWGALGGRLFTTCFCTWMLEVYYRHRPLYGDAAPAAPPAVSDVDRESRP